MQRHILAELEAAVDPVEREECTREQQARAERRPPAVDEIFTQNVGRVGEQIAAEVVDHWRLRELLEVLPQVPRLVLPREVRVRHRETELRQGRHPLGPRERLRKEDDFRMRVLHLMDHPLPERQRLGVWIVDAERLHAVPDPEQQHVTAGFPQSVLVVAPEVWRKDVLILFRWILGVLDRAVGADVKPLGVLLDPRMVGRALQRIVERHFHLQLAGCRDEPIEILERPERRLDRGMAAVLISDRPWASNIIRLRCERVVLALAEAAANRMNRRQIHDIESKLGDPRQLLCRLDKRAVPQTVLVWRLIATRAARVARVARPARCHGAREHLVPRGETRTRAIDDDRQLATKTRQIRRSCVFLHEREKVLIEGTVDSLLNHSVAAILQHLCRHEQRCTRRTRPRAARCRPCELCAFHQLGADVVAGFDLLLQRRSPRAEPVGARFDGE